MRDGKTAGQTMAVVGVLLLALALCGVGWAQDDDGVPRVTLSAQDSLAADVAKQIGEQGGGMQVATKIPEDVLVSLELEDVTVDQAMDALCNAFQGSWARAYLLEKKPPQVAYTADQLITGLGAVREAWLKYVQTLPEEKRREVMMAMFAGRGRGAPGQQPAAAGEPVADGQPAGGAQPAAGGQQPGGPQGGMNRVDWRRRMRQDDPLRELMFRGRTEVITLKLEDATLTEALLGFVTAGGYLLACDPTLTGSISVDLEKAKLSEALDRIAEATEAKWRAVYIVVKPRELTQQEAEERMEQRMEEGFQQRMTDLWRLPPEERVQAIDRVCQMVGRMRGRLEDAPKERQDRAKRFGTRMLSRLSQYSARLNPAQRKELKPLLKAIGQALQ